MTTDVESLETLDDLEACERLQRRLLGESPGAPVLGVPVLRTILASGGLLLGVRADRVTHDLVAAAVDLPARFERFPALFSCFFGVAESSRGRGVGLALRLAERRAAMASDVEVVRAWLDPLRSCDSHLFWNRLGAIGTKYERNLFGDLGDHSHRGLATDRVAVEWWLRSPRTIALVEAGSPASHLRAALHEMAVITRTTTDPSGQRALAGLDADTSADSILLEIPAEIDVLRAESLAEARRWRLETREAFEHLLSSGYLLAGLIHEGGRSFQVLEKADRSAILGRD
jgi:predicted GNAT superfamily acetyltransferase